MLTEVTSVHTLTSGPAERVGIGVRDTVRLSETAPQVPAPVADKVSVILPEEISAAPGEYTALMVLAFGENVPSQLVIQAPPVACSTEALESTN